MKDIFSDIPAIPYEGSTSTNPLAFKYYNPQERIDGISMAEHLRFSIAYWHALGGSGADPFGLPTAVRPWLSIRDPISQAKERMRACFEMAEKLQIPFFCFHDRDIAPEGDSLAETNKNLDTIVSFTAELMQTSTLKLLWGTACLFTHPRFMHGAATSCNPNVFAYAAAQVKKAMEITKELGGANYVFWGGREGYDTLLNTDMQLELDNLARFLHMAVDYAKEIGFDAQLLLEPKPKEPSAHQYDFDAAACIGFLKKYGLDKYFMLNLEQNHAILAGHTYQHEIQTARINGMLGSLDINQGDYLLGWDTDQFNTNLYEAVLMFYEVLKNNGIAPGGLNFDAKLRRASHLPQDIFIAFIASMDTYARALKSAHALLESKEIETFISKRYSGYTEGIGARITAGTINFQELEQHALKHGAIHNTSGRREMLEAIINRYI